MARRHEHTEEQVLGGPTASGERDHPCGGVPTSGHHRADVLYIERKYAGSSSVVTPRSPFSFPMHFPSGTPIAGRIWLARVIKRNHESETSSPCRLAWQGVSHSAEASSRYTNE